MQWNRNRGSFEIRITAVKGQIRAGTLCSQYLTDALSPHDSLSSKARSGPGHGHKWLWISLAVAGAAAAAAIALSGKTAQAPPASSSGVQLACVPIFWASMTRKGPSLILLLWALASAYAQTGLDRPQMGVMLDSSGAARAVDGVLGSILLGDTLATGALSIASSRRLWLVKTDSAILSSIGSVPAPPGPALFALDGATALVYFPASNQLARWHEGQLDFLDAGIPDEVLAPIRAGSGSTLDAAVRRDGRASLYRSRLRMAVLL